MAAAVLIALGSAQMRQCFPVGLPGEIAGLPCLPLPTENLPPGEWSRAVMVNAPRILVTGWGTPPIERTFTTLAGGPVEYLCHIAGGVRHLVTRDVIAEGFPVSNWGCLAAPVVAEHTLMVTIAALRNLPAWLGAPPALFVHEQQERLVMRSLRAQTVGIYGFGGIAREFIDLLQPFHVPITVYSEDVPPTLIEARGARVAKSLEELCARSSVFVCLEALTSKTRRTVGRKELEQLARGSVFVNAGRGAIVDEAALAVVARERELRLACDVFSDEPLAADSPLRKLPVAILSPHVAGMTVDLAVSMGQLAVENSARHLRGERPEFLITLEAFDRAT